MKFGHKKDVTKIFLIGLIFIFCWVALGFSPKNIFYSLHPEGEPRTRTETPDAEKTFQKLFSCIAPVVH